MNVDRYFGLCASAARALLLFAGILGAVACAPNPVCRDSVARPDWWTYESHCPGAPAAYSEVFGASRVRRLDFTIDATVFAQSQSNLTALANTAGTDDLDAVAKPMWMPATLVYEGMKWTQVAVRWKGHASLLGAWNNRIGKLSMRVKFDHFTDGYPELDKQRFFGFAGFTLGDGYKDDSLIRDKTAADIFRAAGVPAPRSSFAQVYIDVGNGPFYVGMYTIIEKLEDQMLRTQVGSDSGNLYKPWGDAARWPPIADVSVPLSTISRADLESHFVKKTNASTDWSDIVAAINVLHSDRTDAAAWRATLESVFNVQAFLKSLAANQTMLNWDSYGCMTHNYYVYADPNDNRRFLWLPWDLNEALADREHDGCVPGSVMMDEIVEGATSITKDWPLIKYIVGDATYRENYKIYLQQMLAGAFAAETVKAQMQADHDLIAPYIDGTIATENGAVRDGLFAGLYTYQTVALSKFQTSLTRIGDGGSVADGLFLHVDKRRAAVAAALGVTP